MQQGLLVSKDSPPLPVDSSFALSSLQSIPRVPLPPPKSHALPMKEDPDVLLQGRQANLDLVFLSPLPAFASLGFFFGFVTGPALPLAPAAATEGAPNAPSNEDVPPPPVPLPPATAFLPSP